jgi:cytochrome c
MIKTALAAAAACLALTAPGFAGDAKLGEKVFNKCKACHSIIKEDGTAVVKGGKVGPNLYGVIGRQIGSYPDFAYGDSIVAAGADGTLWDEAELASYVADPTAWLKVKDASAAAKSKMSFKLASGGEDVAAYLASLKPAE